MAGFRSAHVRPEYSGFADILQFMLIDQDGDQIRSDLQRPHESIREFFYNPSFLVDRPAFSHLDDNHGHNGTNFSGTVGCGSI